MAAVGVVLLGMFAWFGVAMVFRRRFQFSLRLLLGLVVAVALPCSWLAVEMKKSSRTGAVNTLRRRIESSGAMIATDDNGAPCVHEIRSA